MIRGTSEGSETSELEYSARQIQICMVYFCMDIIWKVILKKEVKNKFYKIHQADLNSPRRELSNGGLEIIVALLVHWQIDFLLDCTGDPIQL